MEQCSQDLHECILVKKINTISYEICPVSQELFPIPYSCFPFFSSNKFSALKKQNKININKKVREIFMDQISHSIGNQSIAFI